MITFQRSWDGDGWQQFAFQLVQIRHQPQNVQLVPDKVRGDAGIEFFSTDGCLYQCYAPEEVADVAKAASAMKAKGARDLAKLIKNKDAIAELLLNLKAKRWILLCPFLDDKAVVASVRKHGLTMREKNALPFLSPDFEALVQSQDDFVGELETLKLKSLGPPLKIQIPSDEELAKTGGKIGTRLTQKLERAFPDAAEAEIRKRKDGYVRAHVIRENALDAMRTDHPILWERSSSCLSAEERRLIALGGSGSAPSQQLQASIDRIETSLAADLPTLARSAITEIAVGTVSDWLVRCPLDFPKVDKK